MLAAPWLKSFRPIAADNHPHKWHPQSSRFLKGFLVFPLTFIFVAINLFVLVFPWFPRGQVRRPLVTAKDAGYGGQIVAVGVYGGSILYWAWDRLVLPRLGYRMWVEDDDMPGGEDNLDVKITFKVRRFCSVFFFVLGQGLLILFLF